MPEWGILGGGVSTILDGAPGETGANQLLIRLFSNLKPHLLDVNSGIYSRPRYRNYLSPNLPTVVYVV